MDYREFSNNDLIKRCADESDNQLVWNEFYRRVDEHVRRVVMQQCRLRHLNAQELVDDLTQNVYFRLVENNCKALRTFRGENENAIYAFLAVTTQRVVCTYWHRENAKKRRHIKVPLDEPASSGSAADERLRLIDILANPYAPLPDARLILESLRQEVEMILEELITGNEKERDKKIFLYHVYKGLTPQQISERVGLSAKRIRNIITAVKKRLRERWHGGRKIE
jgi:RNA polymerase sigma factor (sigma-70 family)